MTTASASASASTSAAHQHEWVDTFGQGATDHPIYRKYYHGYVRDTLVQDFHFDQTDRQTSILSLGCGSGIELAILREMGFTRLRGWELLDDMRTLSSVPDLIEVRNICRPQDTPEKFDIGLILGVLHHIETLPEFETLMSNAAAALKPGGRLLIREPRPCAFNRFAIFVSRQGLLNRVLKILSRFPTTADPAIVKLIQQHILRLEGPTILKWFALTDEVVTRVLPRHFQVTCRTNNVNLFIECRKPA